MHAQYAFYFAHFRIKCTKDEKRSSCWLLHENLKMNCEETNDDGPFASMSVWLDSGLIMTIPDVERAAGVPPTQDTCGRMPAASSNEALPCYSGLLQFITSQLSRRRMALETIPSAPTDFDFVIGDWRVKHRRLRERLVNCDEWVEFDGEMSTRKILGGYGNVEDNILYFPEGEFRAIALRSYDMAKATWSIWWLDGRFPDRIDVPVVGSFNDGVGTFFAKDTVAGVPVTVRFIWSQAGADELQWEQAFSPDEGLTWETNWTMAFYRRSES